MKPSHQIRFLVNRIHVGATCQWVAEDIDGRCRHSNSANLKVSPLTRSRAITQAVIAHRRNQILYGVIERGKKVLEAQS